MMNAIEDEKQADSQVTVSSQFFWPFAFGLKIKKKKHLTYRFPLYRLKN
jgi:hypothetical protein